jgi:predicted RNase H-like HicB family nuclease
VESLVDPLLRIDRRVDIIVLSVVFPKKLKGVKVLAMKFVAIIDRDEDGAWVVECPIVPGRVSQGTTREEAVANIREAIAACLEVRAERGMPLTVETQQVEVSV